ncbi:MAG: hypothetical protein LC785_03470 [Acidobacteria bacterium]|nr:hypothetical protein [Acidobacteriota bacterium]MCA1641043.1 hypothetical protein [Acidobacteriota bacterium]
MFTAKLKTLVPALLIVALCASAARAQQSQPTPAPADNYVTNTGFKSRVFEVRNRNPDELLPVLRLLTSGFKGAQVSASNEFHTIIVRDFPENIASIEEALKRLDTPEAPRTDIDLRMHVLIASQTESPSDQYPAELKDVVKQLQSTLTYKGYRLIASISNRVKEGKRINGMGVADVDALAAKTSETREIGATYNYDVGPISISSTSSGSSSVQLENLRFSLSTNVFTPSSYLSTGINTGASLRDGERVVVGTATLKDKGLILIVTVKVIK